MQKEELLKQIAEELSVPTVYDDYVSAAAHVQAGTTLRLVIMGQPNTAKTTFINALLSTSLPTSNLPTDVTYAISYGESSTPPAPDATGLQHVCADSAWLKAAACDMLELNNDFTIDDIQTERLWAMLSQCDAVVYILSAQAPLNRTDIEVLRGLNDAGVPTLLVASRAELLAETDFADVVAYVERNTKHLEHVTHFLPHTSLLSEALQPQLQEAVSTLLSKARGTSEASRQYFAHHYFDLALQQLTTACQQKIDACTAKQQDVERIATEKSKALSDKLTLWISVETQLRQRLFEISEKLRSLLSSRQTDVQRRLAHDVDVCGDIKVFWEKDFNFRLEELLKVEVHAGMQMVNAEFSKTMQWLQAELLRQFRCKNAFTTVIGGVDASGLLLSNDDVSVPDTYKLKIVTRVGTAATVIAAGALFATTGIGGIVMAVSMVSGLGAELFMRKQSNECRETIKSHLPDIINRAQTQLIIDFSEHIQSVTTDLAKSLRSLQTSWHEHARKELEQETTIARFNFSPTKWNNLMTRIDQLRAL